MIIYLKNLALKENKEKISLKYSILTGLMKATVGIKHTEKEGFYLDTYICVPQS